MKHKVNPENGVYEVQDLARGEYVRKPGKQKTYRIAGYCRFNRAYQLDDCDDISRAIYVKRGTKLEAGFIY